jgi:tRNA-2-methylthio-N6-dimethylallyladenosine synthase
MPDLAGHRVHDESRQGETVAPFGGDSNKYHKRFYIESYGCQMNFSDSEIVASILNGEGFGATRNYEEADLVFDKYLLYPGKGGANSSQKTNRIQKTKAE